MLLADFPGPATSSRGISFDASSGEENVFKRALKAKLLLADSLAAEELTAVAAKMLLAPGCSHGVDRGHRRHF